ncbi:unnamed protein product, partial [Cladocopium goreaui]
ILYSTSLNFFFGKPHVTTTVAVARALPTLMECSCVSSDKYFSAARSFGDCAAFCAAQKFPRFHYETTADATGTCACCTFGGIPGTEASTGSVYTYADNATVVVETSHGMAPCFLPLLSLMSLSLL